MSRNTDYELISTDTDEILRDLMSKYEEITGRSLNPADPDRIFLSWIAGIIVQERANINYAANQNIPSRAVGSNLDALGESIFGLKRKPAQAAKVTLKFQISAAQESAIIIPAGTRVTDDNQKLIWATTEDAMIAIGSTNVTVMAQCETPGVVGNGYLSGQIKKLIDVDNIQYFSSVSNTTTSDGGAEEQDDDEYYESLRSFMDSYSTAGSKGSYEYWAMSVSSEIADIYVNVLHNTLWTTTRDVIELEDGSKIAILGGDFLDPETLVVRADESSQAATKVTDYSTTYLSGVLIITLVENGALWDSTSLYLEIQKETPGNVRIAALMKDGTPASAEIRNAIAQVCSSDFVRPLTDHVTVITNPGHHDYDIELTYYIDEQSNIPSGTIQQNVEAAVEEYKKWQCAKFGRDINPSKLMHLLMSTGIKRAEITSPTFERVLDSSVYAKCTSTTIINGGFEHE